jgi:hypothetical protein
VRRNNLLRRTIVIRRSAVNPLWGGEGVREYFPSFLVRGLDDLGGLESGRFRGPAFEFLQLNQARMGNRALGQPRGALVRSQHVGNSVLARRASLPGAGGSIPGASGCLNGPVNLRSPFIPDR